MGLLIYGSLETVSGGYLYDRMLVQALRDAGDAVELISLPQRSYERCLGDNLSPALYRRLAQARLDVLLQDELNHPSLAWINARVKQAAGYPLVSIVHHLRSSEQRPSWQNRLYRAIERRYLRSVDAYVFNSQATRQAVEAAAGGLGRRPWAVAYPAGDRLAPLNGQAALARRVQRLQDAARPLELVFLGNLIRRKGLHTLLEALERLPQGGWRLAVIGGLEVEASYAAQMQRQAQRSPQLRGQVRFLGRLDDAAVKAELERADLLVVPSSYEGFGIVYLEGMAYGMPVIASNAGAAGEIITPGVNGLLVEPEDAAGLDAGLAALLGDRPRLERLSQGALQRYRMHPTWADSGQQIRAFLARLADPGRQPNRADEERTMRQEQ
ncbi:MAG: glycosyltransferase family 4 protein [Chloroflexota bacterium]